MTARTDAQPARRALTLVLLLASLALTALVLEAAVRLAGVSVGSVYINRKTIVMDPNPMLQYALKPSSLARAEVDYRINALGLRGPETTRAKPVGTKRIVVSGDSIAFGYWVSIEDAYPLQLQAIADAATPGVRVEVINLGVPGYNLGQEFELLQDRGLRYAPDLVVINVCMNDLETIFSYEYGLASRWNADRRSPNLWTRLRSLALDHSMLAAFLEYRFSHLDFRRNWASKRFAVGDPDVPLRPSSGAEDSAVESAETRKERSSLRSAMKAFARLLKLNGDIPALVVLFPALDYDFEIYPHGRFHALVEDAVHRAGLPFLDLTACYSRYPAEALAVDPVHPTPLGHRIAAHAIAEAIAREGLLPGMALDGLGDCGAYDPANFPTVRGY